jgi:hypothetical protein
VPSGRDRPDGRVHAALPLLVLILLLSGCGPDPTPTWDQFAVTATPLAEITGYGAVVPYEFTLTNGHALPVFVERIEAKAGRRHQLASFVARPWLKLTEKDDALGVDPGANAKRVLARSGLLLPGQSMTIRIPYRVIAAKEWILFTITPTTMDDLEDEAWLPDGSGSGWIRATEESLAEFGGRAFEPVEPGDLSRAVVTLNMKVSREPTLAAASFPIDAPIAPFDPKWRPGQNDAWSYSPTLGGYVLRVRGGIFRLQTEDDVLPLPLLPFDFLDEVELGRRPKVLLYSGEIREVGKDDLKAFLNEVLRQKREIAYSDEPEKAPYAVRVP